MSKNYLKKVCTCSMLAALFVALEWLASSVGKIAFLDNYQIPISCFPLILASVMFGLRWGTMTALVGSFLSQLLISYSNGYGIDVSTIVWMAPTVIYAVVVALLYMAFRKSDKFYILAIEFFISSIVLSALNTVAMYINNMIYGMPYDFLNKIFGIIVSLKIVGAVAFAIIFAIIVPVIIKAFKKTIKIN